MKFLVIGKSIDYSVPVPPADFAMFLEKIILPGIQMLQDWIDKNKAVGGLFAGQRAGVIIVEAASGEELSSMLQTLPIWGTNTWEIIPLQTYTSGTEDIKRQIERARKMAEMTSNK